MAEGDGAGNDKLHPVLGWVRVVHLTVPWTLPDIVPAGGGEQGRETPKDIGQGLGGAGEGALWRAIEALRQIGRLSRKTGTNLSHPLIIYI
jgi:hypothetical protein